MFDGILLGNGLVVDDGDCVADPAVHCLQELLLFSVASDDDNGTGNWWADSQSRPCSSGPPPWQPRAFLSHKTTHTLGACPCRRQSGLPFSSARLPRGC